MRTTFIIIIVIALIFGFVIVLSVLTEDTNKTPINYTLSKYNPTTPTKVRPNNFMFNYYFDKQTEFPYYKKQKMLQAFEIISNVTKNKFIFVETNSSDNADIIIKYLNNKDNKDGEYIVTGEAVILGYDYYPYRDSYKAELDITNGWIVSENPCPNYPHTELHELLHILGLKHIDTPKSIMYFYGSEFNCINLEDDNETLTNLRQEWGY